MSNCVLELGAIILLWCIAFVMQKQSETYYLSKKGNCKLVLFHSCILQKCFVGLDNVVSKGSFNSRRQMTIKTATAPKRDGTRW